jgi:hypothetical protein
MSILTIVRKKKEKIPQKNIKKKKILTILLVINIMERPKEAYVRMTREKEGGKCVEIRKGTSDSEDLEIKKRRNTCVAFAI